MYLINSTINGSNRLKIFTRALLGHQRTHSIESGDLLLRRTEYPSKVLPSFCAGASHDCLIEFNKLNSSDHVIVDTFFFVCYLKSKTHTRVVESTGANINSPSRRVISDAKQSTATRWIYPQSRAQDRRVFFRQGHTPPHAGNRSK